VGDGLDHQTPDVAQQSNVKKALWQSKFILRCDRMTPEARLRRWQTGEHTQAELKAWGRLRGSAPATRSQFMAIMNSERRTHIHRGDPTAGTHGLDHRRLLSPP
jgi:hypothetical protein